MPKIKINEIQLPEHYIRGSVENKNVKDLLNIVLTHNNVGDIGELKKDQEIVWPFPPIEIAKNLSKKPEKEKGKKKSKGEKKWFAYEILDGVTRWTVAKKLKLKEIDATVKGIDDPKDRFVHQYTTNVGHGLRLDKDARDNAIRLLSSVYKLTGKAIAKECGLDEGSVSRILKNKQRGENAKESRKRLRLRKKLK